MFVKKKLAPRELVTILVALRAAMEDRPSEPRFEAIYEKLISAEQITYKEWVKE